MSNVVNTPANTYLDKTGLEKYTQNLKDFLMGNYLSITEFEDIINVKEITYSELVALRNAGQLIPGGKYRIIDYVTTTAQSDYFMSAGHPFDLIVTAASANNLHPECLAEPHVGDTYFNENIRKWRILYDLDNDSSRYAWANSEGKGVIYRMIDEFENDCYFDFKNLMHKNRADATDSNFYYTFHYNGTDHSMSGKVKNNEIGGSGGANNSFLYPYTIFHFISDQYTCRDNEIKNCQAIYTIIESVNCMKIKIMESSTITLSDPSYVTLRQCLRFVCGKNVRYITGYYSADCSIGKNVIACNFENCNTYITIGDDCQGIKLDSGCQHITIGNNCRMINFGTGSRNITIGASCGMLNFGPGSLRVTLGFDCDCLDFGGYCIDLEIGDNVDFCRFDTTQNCTIPNNVKHSNFDRSYHVNYTNDGSTSKYIQVSDIIGSADNCHQITLPTNEIRCEIHPDRNGEIQLFYDPISLTTTQIQNLWSEVIQNA